MLGKHARHTAKLWRIAHACYPFKPERVLSDNGSQFKAEFTKIVQGDGAVRSTSPVLTTLSVYAPSTQPTISELPMRQ